MSRLSLDVVHLSSDVSPAQGVHRAWVQHLG
jgi:hypothetical protein